MRLVAAFKNSKMDGVFYKGIYSLKLINENGDIEPFADESYYKIFDSVAKKYNIKNELECYVDYSSNSHTIVVEVNLINLLENLTTDELDKSFILSNVQNKIINHFVENELLQKTAKYKEIVQSLQINKLKFDIS